MLALSLLAALLCVTQCSTHHHLLIMPFFYICVRASADAQPAWTEVAPQRPNTAGTSPRTRYSSCMVAIGTDLVVSHGYFYDHSGGGPQVLRSLVLSFVSSNRILRRCFVKPRSPSLHQWLTDTWTYSLERGGWHQRHSGQGTDRPHGRMSHTCVEWRGQLYLFGGDDGGHLTAAEHESHRQSYLNDLWVFDLSTNTWHEQVSKTGEKRTEEEEEEETRMMMENSRDPFCFSLPLLSAFLSFFLSSFSFSFFFFFFFFSRGCHVMPGCAPGRRGSGHPGPPCICCSRY